MQLGTAMAIIALVGSAMTLESHRRAIAMLAVVASGIEVAVAFGVLTLSIAGVELPLVLGAILACVGVVVLSGANRKWPIAGATTITLIGCMQVAVAIDLVHG